MTVRFTNVRELKSKISEILRTLKHRYFLSPWILLLIELFNPLIVRLTFSMSSAEFPLVMDASSRAHSTFLCVQVECRRTVSFQL